MNAFPTSTARLLVDSNGVPRSVALDRFPFTLGRGADCHLLLAHPHVSREHASIVQDAEGYMLRDSGSRHGTFVNGMQVASTRLRNGDRIALGPDCLESVSILFEETETESTTRSLLAQIAHTGPTLGDQSDLQTLTLFLKAAQSLNSYGAINDVLRTMLEYTLRITKAERGFIFLGDSADTLRLECWQDKEGRSTTASVPIGLPSGPVSGTHQERPNISYSVVRQAAASRLDFILSDVTPSDALGHESLILNAIRSVVAMPLRGQSSGRLLGLLYLDSHYAARDFTGTGKQILEALAQQAAMLLENLSMLEAEREAALLRKELTSPPPSSGRSFRRPSLRSPGSDWPPAPFLAPGWVATSTTSFRSPMALSHWSGMCAGRACRPLCWPPWSRGCSTLKSACNPSTSRHWPTPSTPSMPSFVTVRQSRATSPWPSSATTFPLLPMSQRTSNSSTAATSVPSSSALMARLRLWLRVTRLWDF